MSSDIQKNKSGSSKTEFDSIHDNSSSNDDNDSVQILTKSYFFKYVNPNLPIQTHESTLTTISPSTISLLRICTQLCQCSYMKPKKVIWPDEVGEPLLYKTESDVTRIPFFISNSDRLDMIFLVCRGTQCFDDLLTDLMGNCVEVCGGKMHQGVYDTATYIFYNCQNVLRKISEENDRRQIVLTGHSLGAAVASCLCELIKQSIPYLNVSCIALAPPPTVDLGLWQTTRVSTKTFIFEGDCIPFLSLENVVNISVEILPTNAARVVNKFVHKRLKATAKGAYRDLEQVQLCPPGELFLFVVDENGDAQLRKVQPDFFDRLVRGLAETNHFIQNYENLVDNYFKNHT